MPRPLAPLPANRLHRALLGGLLAAALGACAGGSPTRASGKARSTPKAAASTAPKASPTPTPSPLASNSPLKDVQASPTGPVVPEAGATPTTPLLPLRLGLALPASLVGEAAQSRLLGSQAQGALVAPEGSRLVALADGRILSNHAAGLISNHGGGLLSNHGAGLIANNGGGLVANNGGGYRLAQAEASATSPIANGATGGGPTYLWLVLALLDQQDQLLQAFAQADARVGRWRRFGAEGGTVLPPPPSAANYNLAIAQIDAQLRQQHYAGLVNQEADGPHVRMLWLPAADSPLSEGRPLMDYQASGAGTVLRARFAPLLEEAFGMANSASRFDFSQGPLGAVVDGRIGERYLPYEAQSLVGKAINGVSGHSANRRRLRLEAQSLTRSVAIVSRGMIHPGEPIVQRRDLYAFGFASPGQPDLGLASLRRISVGNLNQLPPFSWIGPNDTWVDGAASAPVHFVLPSGERVASAPALAGLVPELPPAPDRDVPEALAPGEDPSLDPALRIPAWPSELLALPE